MISLKKMFVTGCVFVSLATASFAYAAENGTTMGDGLNVRKEANQKSTVVFQLPINKSVKILDKKNGFYKVSYSGKSGWVSQDFLTIDKVESAKVEKVSDKNKEKSIEKPAAKASDKTKAKSENKVTTKASDKAKKVEKVTTKALDKKAKQTEKSADIKTKEQETKIISNNVNVRTKANTNSSVLMKAKLNQKVTVLETEDDWAKIKINGKTGWINTKFLDKKVTKSTEEKDTKPAKILPITGFIKVDEVNVRKSPSESAKIIASIDSGKPVKILEANKEWTKVSTVVTTGWIASKYVTTSAKQVSRGDATLRDTRKSDYNEDLASRIIETGRDYLGTNYVYGGTTPKGFDCSGFIGYIMRKNGIDLPRASYEQATVGQRVNRSDLKPGDLVFFDTDGGKSHISHVGMYIGNDKFIHASSGGDGEVRISSLSEHFYDVTYMTARRVINDN